jgi:nucleoside-diphosphate-sugar epimerase
VNGAIVVTGASGFVGKHLIASLQARELDVRPYSLRNGLPDSIPGGVAHVFHLAAQTYVPESWSNPLSFYETNVLGTLRTLDFCRRVGASITVVSSYVYGKPISLPISENDPIQAFNPYSHTKILAEQAARYYAETFGVPVKLVRPFNLYGPFQNSKFLIPTLLRQALDPASSTISVADSRPRRDFLFINDFIDLLIRTAETSLGAFSIFNAGSGISVSIADLCDIMNTLTGSSKRLVSRGESRPDEVFDVVADISKARRELAWRPNTSLEKGLALTIAAFKQENGESIDEKRSN